MPTDFIRAPRSSSLSTGMLAKQARPKKGPFRKDRTWYIAGTGAGIAAVSGTIALISYTGLVRQDQSQGKWWYGFAASQDSLGNVNAARQGYSRAVNLTNLSANLRRRSQERLAVLSQ